MENLSILFKFPKLVNSLEIESELTEIRMNPNFRESTVYQLDYNEQARDISFLDFWTISR